MIREIIRETGGFWRWLEDGLGLIAIWAAVFGFHLMLEAIYAPVPQ